MSIGLTLAARTIPYLVMGPIGGKLADRVRRKRLMISADLARMGIALLFLLIHTKDQVWIAYLATCIMTAFSCLFEPARRAVIPQLVKTERVVVANAVEESLFGVVLAIGSASGGLVTSVCGPSIAFIVNSASFLVSAALCSTTKLSENHLATPDWPMASDDAPPRPNDDTWDERSYWRWIRDSSLIRILCLQAGLWSVGGGIVNVLLSVFGYQVFHAGNVGVGVMYGSLGLGFAVSSLLTVRLTRRIREAAVLGFVVEGLGHAAMSQSPKLWIASLCLIAATIGAGVGNAAVQSTVMRSLPNWQQGRAFSLTSTVGSVTLGVSMTLTSFLLPIFPARNLGLTAGLLIAISSLATLPFLNIAARDKVHGLRSS
jgi:predicted MFS family arabinose efflux permease